MDEKELIHGCKKGDRLCQKQLFDSYSRAMFLLCLRYLKHEQDAEEIMLNGFYKFLNSIDKFVYGGKGSIGAWMKRIMVNECLMFLRSKKEIKIVDESYAAEVALNEELIINMNAEEIFKLVMALPTGYRTIFNLFVIEGYTHKEIAMELGITEGTSKSQLNKARAMLQKVLEKMESFL